MTLKIDNFFRYYMFHFNAKELSDQEKLKVRVAAVALGVFSLGLIPLICRLGFYDKSSRVKTTALKGLDLEKLKVLEKTLTDEALVSIDLWDLIPLSDSDSVRMQKFEALHRIDGKEPRAKKLIPKFADSKVLSYRGLFSPSHWRCLSDEQVCEIAFFGLLRDQETLKKGVDALFNQDPARQERVLKKMRKEEIEKIAPHLNRRQNEK